MTSLSRRKRQITVRSITAATATKSRVGCLRKYASSRTFTIVVAFILASYIAISGADAFSADEGTSSGKGEIQQVVYTTTKSNAKLKWLPYKPQDGDVEADATHMQNVARWSSDSTAKDSRSPVSNASDDTFGDKHSITSAESVELLKEPMTSSSADLESGSSMPRRSNPAKTTSVKSLALQGKENDSMWKVNSSKSPNMQDQSTDQALNGQNPDINEGCPTVKDLKKISQLTTNIAPSAGDLPKDCPWGGEQFQPRSWSSVTFTWTASGLVHKPLYFEEIQVERYGHTLGPWLQPFASAAHFFIILPILPYEMGLELPNECMYTLGYYRPGSCAPYMLDPLPLSIRAGLFEAGAWVGGVAIIP